MKEILEENLSNDVIALDEAKKSYGSVTWKKVFGVRFQNWDDPEILTKLRKQAIAVVYAAMRGKKIPEPQRKMAESVFEKMVAQNKSSNVHFHLNFKDIEEAKRKAGLISVKALKP